MDDEEPTLLRSGRRWRRRAPPSPVGRESPDANADQEVSGSSGPRCVAPLFSCCVCLETAKDPVVTRCGHLFCWPCLYRSVQRCRPRGRCPMCKSTVTTEPGDEACVIPIYGVEWGSGLVVAGGADENLSSEVPPRPRGLHTTSEREDLEVLREKLRVLSGEVDELEQRMWRVMAMVAQLPPPLFVAYAEEVARRNYTSSGTLAVGTTMTRSTVVRTHDNDDVNEGIYRRTRSRTRQANS